MTKRYVIAIDEGTTGSTALLIDAQGEVVARAYRSLNQMFPQAGWVEHDPEEILNNCISITQDVVRRGNVSFGEVAAIGITNQRETTVVWERETGKPVFNAIVWQCRRTSSICERLIRAGFEAAIKQKTGLSIDPYFSATKIRWLLDAIPDGQQRAERGELLFGTIDSWLVWHFTGGKVHSTDYSNASRTMLYNIHTLAWDDELLDILDIPAAMMPEVRPSSAIYGETRPGLFETMIPIAGIAGDQQAALFGQACFEAGMVKNTYGTGSFVLMNTGAKPISSQAGLITTLAWGLGDRVTYALEGSIFVTGAAVQWLRDGLGLIEESSEIGALASRVPDNGGVYFVPAFVGLGAPHWDMYARGTILGLTRGSTSGHIARAVEESIAYQTRDVIEAMKEEAGLPISLLRVDGGGSVDEMLMQFQADLLGIPIERARFPDTTALGAAYLAGLATGVWQDTNEIASHWQSSGNFYPSMAPEQRESFYNGWKRAVARSRGWAKPQ